MLRVRSGGGRRTAVVCKVYFEGGANRIDFSVTSQRREKSRVTSGFWSEQLEEGSLPLLVWGGQW